MSGAWSLRHSAQDRPPGKPPAHQEPSSEGRSEVSDREAERLAEKIVSVGADYMDAKSREQYGDEWQADDNAAPTMDADSMANKLMKVAAREMARNAAKHHGGQVFPGSDAAKAEAVYAARHDTRAPMHKVADKVREKMAAAEGRAAQASGFVGVNPGGEATPDVLRE